MRRLRGLRVLVMKRIDTLYRLVTARRHVELIGPIIVYQVSVVLIPLLLDTIAIWWELLLHVTDLRMMIPI